MNQKARLAHLATPLATPLGPLGTINAPVPRLRRTEARQPAQRTDKRLASLALAFDAFDISDGAVLSFHHHYRNGDRLMNAVMAEAARRGLRGLTLAASSLFPVHAPLVPLIENGTIAHIVTDYMRGPVADAVARGALRGTCILQSHGGRARAIAARQLPIDVAFIAAPRARPDGATTGRAGALACGPLGYPAVDAAFARASVVVASDVTDAPLPFVDIPPHHIDAVVKMDAPGAVDGIASGTTLPAASPTAQRIGALVARAIAATGLMRQGLSLQSGAGGFSLAAVDHIAAAMRAAAVHGSFMSGGITAMHAEMLRSGLFEAARDVQCFDLAAVASAMNNPRHTMMTAEEYASPLHPTPVVDALDVMLLGAVEVDAAFNVNVVRGGDGRILGGPGGHPDAAAGAKLSIVTTELTGGGFAKLVPEAACVSTAGKDVDLIVTDQGIAVNSSRGDLCQDLRKAGLPVRPFEALAARAAAEAHKTTQRASDTPRLLIEAREGRIMDWA